MRRIGLWAAAFVLTSALCDAVAASETTDALFEEAVRARRVGDRDAELGRLSALLDADAGHCAAHARLAELTGLSARRAIANLDDRVVRAASHPYDPWALLAAARVLADREAFADAVEHLERAVWLADVDPVSALDALVLLRQIEPRWRGRRIVPVHVYADAEFRAHPGWRFRLRTLWLAASRSLDPVLSTRFVPIAIGTLDLGGVSNDVDAMHSAGVARVRPPEEGILALISGRPLPDGYGVHKKGVAEFLGRDLLVRVAPDARQSRVLAHEILHLFGAIHMLDDVESLMNPTGTSLTLDASNVSIARAMLPRTFTAGGIEQDILRTVDLRAATDAYIDALSVNLAIRERGLAAARSEVIALDAHLADASRLLAALMVADARPADAVRLLELAESLYGPQTERGVQAGADARELRTRYGLPAS
jgi:hypothetical protein